VTDITWTSERRKLSDLIPWPRNPRQITKDQARRLSESLDEFGQVQTIAISPENQILDGHQRQLVWAASEKFGADLVVDVRVASRALTEKEREKLAVYLHKGAAGEWDFDVLANEFELDELLDWGFTEYDFQLAGVEWGDDEPAEDPGPQVDRAEELQQKWQVQRGQVWEIGRHRLMCGDSADAGDVGRLMGGARAGAVVTDPPYGIEREGIANDDPKGLRDLFGGCLAAMPIDDAVVIAFQSPRLFPVWLDAARAMGHEFQRALWLYRTGQGAFPWRGWYMRSDIILVSTIGAPRWPERPIATTDCLEVNINDAESIKATAVGGDSSHSTIKPLDVVRGLVEHTSGVAFEPFAGSGTTLVACEQTGRIGYGMEICEKYCAVTLERLTGMGLEAKVAE